MRRAELQLAKATVGLPTPGTDFRGVPINAALQEQLQRAVGPSRDRMGLIAVNVARSGKRKVSRPFFV
jgi:hypothetical protein